MPSMIMMIRFIRTSFRWIFSRPLVLIGALGLMLAIFYGYPHGFQQTDLTNFPVSAHGNCHQVLVRYTIPLPHQLNTTTYEAVSRQTNTEAFVASVHRESTLARIYLSQLAQSCQELNDYIVWSCSMSNCDKITLKEKTEDIVQRLGAAKTPTVKAEISYQHCKSIYNQFEIEAKAALEEHPLTKLKRDMIKFEPYSLWALNFWKLFGKEYYHKKETLRQAQAAREGWDSGLSRVNIYVRLLEEATNILDRLRSVILQGVAQGASEEIRSKQLLEWFRQSILHSDIPALWNKLSASMEKEELSLSLDVPSEQRCRR